MCMCAFESGGNWETWPGRRRAQQIAGPALNGSPHSPHSRRQSGCHAPAGFSHIHPLQRTHHGRTYLLISGPIADFASANDDRPPDRFHLRAHAGAAMDEVLRSRRRHVEYVVLLMQTVINRADTDSTAKAAAKRDSPRINAFGHVVRCPWSRRPCGRRCG